MIQDRDEPSVLPRIERTCGQCGYGVVVSRLPHACPQCRATDWRPVRPAPVPSTGSALGSAWERSCSLCSWASRYLRAQPTARRHCPQEHRLMPLTCPLSYAGKRSWE